VLRLPGKPTGGAANCSGSISYTLDEVLARSKSDAECAVHVVDLRSGDVAHSLKVEGLVSELYDVVVLPDRTNTAAIGFRTDEIRRVISIE